MWIVVDAINQCPQFKISYPDLLEEQRTIAAGFEAASTLGIKNCAGAIDGILILMLKPSPKEATKAGVDQKKIYVDRNTSLVSIVRQCLIAEIAYLIFLSSTVVHHWIVCHLRQVSYISGLRAV